jgi:PII-like signaling protein
MDHLNMRSAQRLEIFASEIDAEEIGRILQKCGAKGYTIFPQLAGWGDRGRQHGDEVSFASYNVCIVCLGDETMVCAAVEKLLPLLALRGGLCAVSPAQYITGSMIRKKQPPIDE